MNATLEATAIILITEFLEGIQQKLIDDLTVNNRNATGKTKDSIQLSNLTTNGGQIVANSNILYTFTGRGPGKMPPISALIDWCNARGLPRAVAWAVATNIAKAGTELFRKGAANNNTLASVLSADAIKVFTDSIKTQYVSVIKSDISSLINK